MGHFEQVHVLITSAAVYLRRRLQLHWQAVGLLLGHATMQGKESLPSQVTLVDTHSIALFILKTTICHHVHPCTLHSASPGREGTTHFVVPILRTVRTSLMKDYIYMVHVTPPH